MLGRVWFEVRAIWAFLVEVVGHPLTTSRMAVDPDKRDILVERF